MQKKAGKYSKQQIKKRSIKKKNMLFPKPKYIKSSHWSKLIPMNYFVHFMKRKLVNFMYHLIVKKPLSNIKIFLNI